MLTLYLFKTTRGVIKKMTTSDDLAFSAIGLVPREIQIYKALLQLGPASIRDVAAESGINRGTAYETLKKLAEKGIVNYFPRGKRRFFQAESPERLLSLGEERQSAIEIAIQQLREEIVPSLKQAQPEMNLGNVRFYEGYDGVALVLGDILETTETELEPSYSVISTQRLREHLYKPFPNFTRQRVNKGIKVRVIAVGEGGDDAELAERKWLPGGKASDASYIAIYPPKVAMITLARPNYPVVIIIDSEAIASTQQIMFNTLWGFL